MKLLALGLSTGDATPLRAYSDERCGGCANLIGAVEDLQKKGHRAEGGGITVLFAVSPALAGGETIVDLRYERSAGTVVDRAGVTVAEIPAASAADVQLRVRRSGGSWTVLGYRNAAAG